jgi:hypothetical protein
VTTLRTTSYVLHRDDGYVRAVIESPGHAYLNPIVAERS